MCVCECKTKKETTLEKGLTMRDDNSYLAENFIFPSIDKEKGLVRKFDSFLGELFERRR